MASNDPLRTWVGAVVEVEGFGPATVGDGRLLVLEPSGWQAASVGPHQLVRCSKVTDGVWLHAVATVLALDGNSLVIGPGMLVVSDASAAVRVNVNAPVHLRWLDGDHERDLRGMTVDLSTSGAAVIANAEELVGREVCIELNLDNGSLRALGRCVAANAQSRARLTFLAMTDHHAALLAEFVARRSQPKGPPAPADLRAGESVHVVVWGDHGSTGVVHGVVTILGVNVAADVAFCRGAGVVIGIVRAGRDASFHTARVVSLAGGVARLAWT